MCACKSPSYDRFTTRQHQLIPIFGFGRRTKSSVINRHWLSGKGGMQSMHKSSTASLHNGQCPNNGGVHQNNHCSTGIPNQQIQQQQQQHDQRNHFNRHLAMNLENDMYYTVDFSDSQHSPLIQ